MSHNSVRLGCDIGADEAEGVVGVLAESGNGRNADNDDQGQHHGILDGGGAIFLLEERHDAVEQAAHGNNS
jgi:hypothetical protein